MLEEIFGLQNAKMIFGETEVDLPHTRLSPRFVIPKIIEDESIISNRKHFNLISSHSQFTIYIHLFEYEDPDGIVRTLESYKGGLCAFYPHKEGEPLKNIYGDISHYYLCDIKYYKFGETMFKHDIAELLLKNQDKTVYTNLTFVQGYGYGYGLNYGGQL